MSVNIHDQMFVTMIDKMGSDVDIARNAWVSTKGERAEEEADISRIFGLINFLMKGRHGSPFEAGVMKFLIRVPIFVMREHHRHRMFSYNEESGRYKQLSPDFYVPGADRPLVQIGKAGAYEFVPGDDDQYLRVSRSLVKSAEDAYSMYEEMLENGIAREVARMCLPVNIYSSCYVTCNLRSLMNFLSLRTKHPEAAFPSYPQREIEMVAEGYEAKFALHFPQVYRAFIENGRVAP